MTETAVTITTFGFLHGSPPDGHLVLDLRHHFRDPHINPALREMTAHDAPVRQAVLSTPGIGALIEGALVAIAAFHAGPRPGPVHVAVGCAGGRHRAAVVGQALADRLHGAAALHHRDLHRPVVDRHPKTAGPSAAHWPDPL